MAFLEIDKRNILVHDKAENVLFYYAKLCTQITDNVTSQFGIDKSRFCRELVPVVGRALDDLEAIPGYDKLLSDYIAYILAYPIGVLVSNMQIDEEEAKNSAWDFVADVFVGIFGADPVDPRKEVQMIMYLAQIVYMGTIEFLRRNGLNRVDLEKTHDFLDEGSDDYDAITLLRRIVSGY